MDTKAWLPWILGGSLLGMTFFAGYSLREARVAYTEASGALRQLRQIKESQTTDSQPFTGLLSHAQRIGFMEGILIQQRIARCMAQDPGPHGGKRQASITTIADAYTAGYFTLEQTETCEGLSTILIKYRL